MKTALVLLCTCWCLNQSVFASIECRSVFTLQKQPSSEEIDRIWNSLDSNLESQNAQKYLTEDSKDTLEQIFVDHDPWFFAQSNLELFEGRLSRFGNKIFPLLSDSVLEISEEQSINQSIIFSLIAKANIKDWVWKHAPDGRERLEAAGVDPLKLMNMSDPKTVSSLLKQVATQNKLVKKEGLIDDLLLLTGYSLNELLASEHLQNIYADEISESLSTALTKVIKNTPSHSAKYQLAKKLLDELNHDQKNLSMRIAPRSLASFENGKCSGDCTAPGRENYWTVGSWVSTFENIEIHFYHNNKFFARMMVVLGFSNQEPVAYVHAFEFNPKAQNPRTTLYKNRIDHFISSLHQAQKFFANAGIDRLILTRISNSSEYADSLQEIASNAGIMTGEPQEFIFEILTRQESSHNILRQELGKERDGIPIYMQGWLGSFNFSYQHDDTIISKPIDNIVTLSSGHHMKRLEVQRASHLILAYVHEHEDAMKRKVDPILNNLYEVYSQGISHQLPPTEFARLSGKALQELNKVSPSKGRSEFLKKPFDQEAMLTRLEDERLDLDQAFNPSGEEVDHLTLGDINAEVRLAIAKSAFMFSITEHKNKLIKKLRDSGFSERDISVMLQDIDDVLQYASVRKDNLELTSEQSSLVEGIEVFSPDK